MGGRFLTLFGMALSTSQNHVALTEAFSSSGTMDLSRAKAALGDISPRHDFTHPSYFVREKRINTRSPLMALLPWEYDEDDESVILAERITLDNDKTAKLARLAVAFSPPEQKLSMEHVDSVQVVCVDEKHIEISAVVCEEECVSVLIPLTFPHYCGIDEDMEECVLENVEELDAVAECKISEMNAESEENTCENNYDDINLHASNTPYNFPEWWMGPSDGNLGISSRECIELDDECRSIARLLNEEDFRQDVRALATQGLYNSLGMDGDAYEIEKAVVSFVGPMGVCLRAKAKKEVEKGFTFIDIPISFGRDPAVDRNELRAAVLGTIASVHVD